MDNSEVSLRDSKHWPKLADAFETLRNELQTLGYLNDATYGGLMSLIEGCVVFQEQGQQSNKSINPSHRRDERGEEDPSELRDGDGDDA